MSDAVKLDAVPVRVLPGCVVYRHGKAWSAGQVLATTPADAFRLVHYKDAERV